MKHGSQPGPEGVAEGVETQDIWDRLFAFGCDASTAISETVHFPLPSSSAG
jgi:hypothetical protein